MQCNQSCKCGGYYLPKIGDKCSIICGDNIKVDEEQCDDGNTYDHDGCNQFCQKQNCTESCLCNDGWVQPWINGSCSTQCGDHIVLGKQQCDDQNHNNYDECSNQCKLNHFIITKQATQIPSIFLYFLFGFRLIGVQMLLVLQNFQMILQVKKMQLIQINFNIHGLSYLQYFPFSDIPFFQHFNVMSLCIFVLSFIWILWQIIKSVITYVKSKNNSKISNVQNQINPTIGSEFPSSQQLKIQSQIKNQSNFSVVNDDKNIILKYLISLTSLISLPQIIFNLIINNLSIFTFSLIKTIQKSNEQSIFNNLILNIPTLITIFSYLSLLIGLLAYCILQNNEKFGQNQNKLSSKLNLILYWLIAIGERIIFSGLIAVQTEYYLYIIAGIKLILIFFMSFKNLLVQKIQQIRNLITQGLHFLLITVMAVNKQVLFKIDRNYLNSNIPSHFWEYLSISIVGCVVFISTGFIIKQFVASLKLKIINTIQNNQNQVKNAEQLKTETIKIAQITEFNSQTIINGQNYNKK